MSNLDVNKKIKIVSDFKSNPRSNYSEMYKQAVEENKKFFSQDEIDAKSKNFIDLRKNILPVKYRHKPITKVQTSDKLEQNLNQYSDSPVSIANHKTVKKIPYSSYSAESLVEEGPAPKFDFKYSLTYEANLDQKINEKNLNFEELEQTKPKKKQEKNLHLEMLFLVM